MEYKEFDDIYGGQHPDAVQEFPIPGQLTEEELMGVISFPERDVAVDYQFQQEENFRPKSVEKEKEAMFTELEIKTSTQNTTSRKM